jgi:hypothetical protein
MSEGGEGHTAVKVPARRATSHAPREGVHHMINHIKTSAGVCRSGSNGQTPPAAQNNLTPRTDLPATRHTHITHAFTQLQNIHAHTPATDTRHTSPWVTEPSRCPTISHLPHQAVANSMSPEHSRSATARATPAPRKPSPRSNPYAPHPALYDVPC